MKTMWKNLREWMDKGLRRQLVFYLTVSVLLPLAVVTTALFLKARQEMKNQEIINIRQRVTAIAAQVDELIYNVQSVSDKFAYDEEIEAYIEKNYKDQSIEKQRDIYEWNKYITKTDLFGKSERLDAVYTRRREVFNCLEPYLDGKEVKQKMVQLGATDRERLSMFQWSSLQDNFLKSSIQGDVRQDQVVFGVRRILHPFTGLWMYTQFFAIEEAKFYNLYQESAAEMKGKVYLVNRGGGLISSSDERTVEAGSVPGEIIRLAEAAQRGNHQVKYNEDMYIMDLCELENADWRVVTMVPVSAVTAPIDRLFKEILAVLAVCVVVCLAIISWLSRRFLQPVEVLDASMKEVYDGNLKAYVEPEAYHGEMRSMMTYYNSMLVEINRYIEEKVESEKKKKELELEVLMGQINPHFLYNTLENIVWKSNEVGRPDIGRLAASLGRLYRLSIGNGETIVPIRQEVEHMMAYVNIQKNRYKERVDFDLEVNYEEVWEYFMIKLTLQPVVENCFMYGMEDIDRVLKIRVKIRKKGELIQFLILDNGCGMTKNQLEAVKSQMKHGRPRQPEGGRKKHKGTGIGLYSVRERIAIYTGYKDSVRIQSKAGMGTLVAITVPKMQGKDKNNQ